TYILNKLSVKFLASCLFYVGISRIVEKCDHFFPVVSLYQYFAILDGTTRSAFFLKILPKFFQIGDGSHKTLNSSNFLIPFDAIQPYPEPLAAWFWSRFRFVIEKTFYEFRISGINSSLLLTGHLAN